MSPRRSKGDGSVFQRHDHPTCPPKSVDGTRPPHRCKGHWVGQLSLGVVNGERRGVTYYAKTRKEAGIKLATAQTQLAAGTLAIATPTVEQWLAHWLDLIAAPRVRPTTMRGYREKVSSYLVPLIGNHRLTRLEPAHVRAMYARMREPCPAPVDGKCPHKPSHGLAEATIRQTHAILKRALKDALRDGKVSRNVTDAVDAPHAEQNTPRALTLGEAQAALEAAEGTRFESRWWVALYLGLRQGEALGLLWDYVDLDAGLIEVAVTTHGAPKSKASRRVIPVPPMVVAKLRQRWVDYLSERDDEGYEDNGLVWCMTNGRPLSAKADWSMWRDLLLGADVEHVSLHAARKTAGTLLNAAGVSPRIATDILGHATVQLTQDVYMKGDLAQRREGMLALESYVRGRTTNGAEPAPE